MTSVRIALAQTHVGPDVAANGGAIRKAMQRAKHAGARLVHFSEGALSGYGRKELTPFADWTDHDWRRLRTETDRIIALAATLNLWVVFGSVSPTARTEHPFNCLFVVNPTDGIHARYDKRYCSHNELAGWYTPGFDACTFEVDGVRFGCLICLDGRFTNVWEEYRRLGVHCVLFSSFTAGRHSQQDAEGDAIFGITAQAQAGNHTYWVSFVTPANPVQGSRTQFINPLGAVEASCRRHGNHIAVGSIDLGKGGLWEATKRGRAWRDAARQGDIYRKKAGLEPHGI